MFRIVQSICLRITIFNIIVHFYCIMCTKSPVREIATIEGTSRHQRLTNYHNQWESGLLVFMYNMKHTSAIIHILCARVPISGWSSAVKSVISAQSYTYHSLKLEERPLWLVVCTAEAGDMVVLLWVSVVGDTRPGGVEDSYPELAAGEESDAGGDDSWTWRKKKYTEEEILKTCCESTSVVACK